MAISIRISDKKSYIEVKIFDKVFTSVTIAPALDYVAEELIKKYPRTNPTYIYESVAKVADSLVGVKKSALMHARICAWRDAQMKKARTA